ncbi:MAG: RsmE family RNA methyltransferase [Synergistaceae bacterium]
MSQPRLRLETCTLNGKIWKIDEEQAHHLVRVRRCYTGSLVEGLLSGEKILLKLICDGEEVKAEEISRTEETPAGTEVHLLLGLLKNDQFDDALRFSAETGVHTIHLLACERSVPSYEGKKLEEKMNRWNKILAESTKQAGSTIPPILKSPLKLADINFNELPKEKYAALLSPLSKNLKDLTIPESLVIAIGPEGDWSLSESQKLLDMGFTPVSLGKRILRASTAVAVACGWLSLVR